MSNFTSVVDKYIEVWNESDEQSRRTLIAQIFAEDALYSDPLASVRGQDAINQLIAGAQSRFDGLRFSLAGPVDAHHDQARFTWHLGSPEAEEPIVIGFDVAVMEDNRIHSVYGFIDKAPTLA